METLDRRIAGGPFRCDRSPTSYPVEAMSRRLFGYPVVVTPGIAAGMILCGAFDTSAMLFMREEARVDWSEHVYSIDYEASDFQRNLIRFRCELRAKVAVTRPSGFVTVTGS